jgi:hypothetical protein
VPHTECGMSFSPFLPPTGETVDDSPPDEPSGARAAGHGPTGSPRQALPGYPDPAGARLRAAGIFADARIGRRIALAYAAAPAIEARALPAYRRLREELPRQYDLLTRPRRRRGMGIAVEVTARNPYASAAEMIADIRDNRRLLVYSTAACGNHHPFFTDDENDLFRAVHDAFGHALTGSTFDRHGEEIAWRMHSGLLSPLAAAALATETRGQTSARVWSSAPHRFPEQKVFILPPRLRDARGLHPARVARKVRAALGRR